MEKYPCETINHSLQRKIPASHEMYNDKNSQKKTTQKNHRWSRLLPVARKEQSRTHTEKLCR
jgi:hypothetical protein